MFDNLGLGKRSEHQPGWLSLVIRLKPLAKVGGQSIKVVLQSVRAKDRHTTRGESVLEFMNNGISHVLSTCPELNNGDQFGFGIADRPYPDFLLSLFDIRPQFVQLNVYQIKIGQKALVQFPALLTASTQPGTQGRFTDIDGFFDGRSVYPKSEQVENKTHGSRMRFQTIEYGVSADGEFLMAGLAEQILDIFVFAMRTIPNQGMDGFVRNQIVGTSWIGTEVALGPDRFLFSAFAFDSTPWDRSIWAGVRNRLAIGRDGCSALWAVLLTFWL